MGEGRRRALAGSTAHSLTTRYPVHPSPDAHWTAAKGMETGCYAGQSAPVRALRLEWRAPAGATESELMNSTAEDQERKCKASSS